MVSEGRFPRDYYGGSWLLFFWVSLISFSFWRTAYMSYTPGYSSTTKRTIHGSLSTTNSQPPPTSNIPISTKWCTYFMTTLNLIDIWGLWFQSPLLDRDYNINFFETVGSASVNDKVRLVYILDRHLSHLCLSRTLICIKNFSGSPYRQPLGAALMTNAVVH